jgi:hypothetical protein
MLLVIFISLGKVILRENQQKADGLLRKMLKSEEKMAVI